MAETAIPQLQKKEISAFPSIPAAIIPNLETTIKDSKSNILKPDYLHEYLNLNTENGVATDSDLVTPEIQRTVLHYSASNNTAGMVWEYITRAYWQSKNHASMEKAASIFSLPDIKDKFHKYENDNSARQAIGDTVYWHKDVNATRAVASATELQGGWERDALLAYIPQLAYLTHNDTQGFTQAVKALTTLRGEKLLSAMSFLEMFALREDHSVGKIAAKYQNGDYDANVDFVPTEMLDSYLPKQETVHDVAPKKSAKVWTTQMLADLEQKGPIILQDIVGEIETNKYVYGKGYTRVK